LFFVGRLLVLVACFPLVMPSQVCLCHANDGLPTPIETVPLSVPVPVQTTCCSHKKNHYEHLPVSTPEKSCFNDTDSDSPDEPTHEPYCPILWDSPFTTLSDSSTMVLVALVFDGFTLPENHLPNPPPDFVTPVSNVSSCPLYLSHCRFNI